MRRILLLCLTAVFMLTSIAWAQERTVTGRVTSAEDGSGLPGVNVLVKGTTQGTVTDTDGNYSLSVPSTGGTLVFTFIGLLSQEIEIGDRTAVDVQLAQDVQQLNEVLVTAFGIERPKNEITYVAEKINSSDLTVAQQTTAAQGLAGKIAGLQINVQNNGVNPTSQILLRGLRSITGNNGALIVIDGMISSQSAFDDLNPNDIADINVLKGPNAAALYGANAANGALVVITKNGNANNRFSVGLISNFTADQVAYMPDFQTKHGIGWAGNYDPIENTNWGPRFDGVTRRIGPIFADGTFQAVPYAPIKDNLKDFYETGQTFQNTVYASGGNADSKFYLSIGNRKTQGIVPDDEYERTTFRVNASHKIGKLTLGINSSYFYDDTDVVGNTIGDQDRPLYWFVLNTPANIPLSTYKDWNNPKSYGYADNYYNAYYQNPYWAVGTNRNMDKTTRLQANVSIGIDITENIKWNTILGVNSFAGTGKNWRARQEYDPVLQPSHSTVTSFTEDSEFQRTDYNGSSIVRGDFKINEDFSIKPLLGFSFIQNSFRSSLLRGNNLSIPGNYDISNRTGELQGTVDEEEQREVGFFGELNVGFRDYLFLNLTGRQDFTSTLPLDDNGYFYPAIGLSFVASEAIESLKNSRVISDLKLTVSNSTVYNDLGPYDINERYVQPTSAQQPGQFPYPLGPINGFALSGTTVDAGIQKEKLNTTEIGAAVGFFNNRATLSASWFDTKITNLIVDTTPSTASGATLFSTNIGQLDNQGFELSLGGAIINSGDFKWDLNLNYTRNETVVKEITEGVSEVGIDVYTAGYGTYAVVGLPFPQIKASSYVRDPQGRVVVGSDGNPIVGDVIALGKATPDYIIGATSTFGWKGLALSATIDYRTGHVYYEQGSDQMEFTGRSIASVSTNRQDFVWPNSVFDNGDGTYTPNTNIPITGGVMTFWQNRYNEIKENYVKDATALKLREVALNYTVPKSLLAKTKVINKLTIGFVGRNLLTYLPEENRFADPEFNNFSEGTYNANSIGIGGYLQSPPTRSYGVNLNIEF